MYVYNATNAALDELLRIFKKYKYILYVYIQVAQVVQVAMNLLNLQLHTVFTHRNRNVLVSYVNVEISALQRNNKCT